MVSRCEENGRDCKRQYEMDKNYTDFCTYVRENFGRFVECPMETVSRIE